MNVYSNNSLPCRNKFVATIGGFDGLHLGHQLVLRKLAKRAKRLKASSLVITFWPNPKKVLKDLPACAHRAGRPAVQNSESFYLPSDKFAGHLMDISCKKKELFRLGIDCICVLRTNPSLLNTSGYFFIDKIVHKFPIVEIIVGEDFRFGQNGLWGVDRLKSFTKIFKFNLKVIKKIKLGRKTISSSLIRKLLRQARFKEAGKLMGRDYILSGKVINGYGLGRKLGYPTANIDNVNSFVIPREGVYAVYVYYAGRIYLGAFNIGINPTVRLADKPSLEVYILGFNRNIIGKNIKIVFLERIRKEKKFSSLIALKTAIAQDIDFISSRYSVSRPSSTQPVAF